MKTKIRYLLYIILILNSTFAFAQEKISIALFSPGTKEDTFWSDVMDFAQAAADDLDIDLKIYYGDRLRAKTIDSVKEIIESKDKVDFIVFSPHQYNGPEILKMVEEAEIPTFSYNSEPFDNKGNRPGKPREDNKYWIGEMFPDDAGAAKDLTHLLAKKAREIGLADSNGKVTVLPIDGNLSDGAGISRNSGFNLALQEDTNLIATANNIKGFWKKDLTKRNFKFAYSRYNEKIQVVWAANDIMLMGAIESLDEDFDKKLGKDIVLGAFDWNEEILDEISKGRVYAAYGGHFTEAGWIMVMLYDYYHGIDFADTEGVSIKSKMSAITTENYSKYDEILTSKNWSSIDFKKFSKIHSKYSFGPHILIEN